MAAKILISPLALSYGHNSYCVHIGVSDVCLLYNHKKILQINKFAAMTVYPFMSCTVHNINGHVGIVFAYLLATTNGILTF